MDLMEPFTPRPPGSCTPLVGFGIEGGCWGGEWGEEGVYTLRGRAEGHAEELRGPKGRGGEEVAVVSLEQGGCLGTATLGALLCTPGVLADFT